MLCRHRLGAADPEINLTVTRLQKRLIVIKFLITETGKMVLRETSEKEVGFLHAGIAGLIDQPADPGVAGLGHVAWLPEMVHGGQARQRAGIDPCGQYGVVR